MTHTINATWSDGNASVAAKKTATGEAAQNLDVVIPALTTDQLVAFVMDVSQLKSLFLLAVDGALLVETNATTGVNVFTLAANVPFVWVNVDAALRDTAGTAVTVDITNLRVTNGTAADLTLRIRALYDPTV